MPPSLKLVPSDPDGSGRARYALLAQALRRRIQAGEWVPGVALPSEQTLAQESQVALGTMRRALQLLVDEGLIERVHGRGTFVREGLSGASMLRFFRFDAEHGSVPRSTILSARRAVPPAEVLRLLGRPPAQEALQLKRLRSIDDAPCLLETIWLPLPEFEALVDDDTATWADLLYPMYAQRCGVRVHRAVDTIAFGHLAAAQARRLDLTAGHPCAVVHRAAYDIAGRCVEVRVTRGDANAFHYTVTLT
ncbi:GntR family transcriptional regulator [Ideonella sp. YS5]|uniref:GntR family transcriptional regulator n=1 Tax=Ideonella sp. YS5 TaxID=3453714 RepID=UPI003EEBE152